MMGMGLVVSISTWQRLALWSIIFGKKTVSLPTSLQVRELRAGIKKVVFMGHSTGSQDVIHYLTSPSDLTSRPGVEGGIMQAPASDREYFSGGDDSGINAWLSNLPIAERMMKDGKGDQVMDATACEAMGIRITAYRLWSLLSEV
jgi:hypothetical protein